MCRGLTFMLEARTAAPLATRNLRRDVPPQFYVLRHIIMYPAWFRQIGRRGARMATSLIPECRQIVRTKKDRRGCSPAQRGSDWPTHSEFDAIEVHAIDQQAKAFYEKYGFVPLVDNEFHLFLPIATVQAVIAS